MQETIKEEIKEFLKRKGVSTNKLRNHSIISFLNNFVNQ